MAERIFMKSEAFFKVQGYIDTFSEEICIIKSLGDILSYCVDNIDDKNININPLVYILTEKLNKFKNDYSNYEAFVYKNL